MLNLALNSIKKLFYLFLLTLAPNVPGIHIQGKGLLADLLKSVVKAFQPMGIELEIDTVPCLPDPIPPDYDRYIQIGCLNYILKHKIF